MISLFDEVISEAGHRQRIAADPNHSAWVAASAGTGKTKVLSDRVLNLLLEGTAPERLLCLTYTRAAAAEMSERLAKTLALWASMPEPDLARTLAERSDEPPSGDRVRAARRLFARVLDAPGGLRIQTIHGFCQSLWPAFPWKRAWRRIFASPRRRRPRPCCSRRVASSFPPGVRISPPPSPKPLCNPPKRSLPNLPAC